MLVDFLVRHNPAARVTQALLKTIGHTVSTLRHSCLADAQIMGHRSRAGHEPIQIGIPQRSMNNGAYSSSMIGPPDWLSLEIQ